MSRPSANYSKREQKQARAFLAEIYVDSEEYDTELILNRLPYFWDKFYYILHDKDVYTEDDMDKYLVDHNNVIPSWSVGQLKKAHYHLIGYCSSPCMLGRAAKKFGIRSQFVQVCNNLKKSVQYLIHLNCPNKYQYMKEEVVTNSNDLDKLLKVELEAEEKAAILVDAIFSSQITSIASLAKFAIDNHCWDELRRGQHIYSALLFEKINKQVKEKNKIEN